MAVVFLSGCASSQNTDDDFHGTPQLAAKEMKQNTQKAMFAYDAQQLVYAVEAAHPAFVLDGMLPENYEEAKKNFLKSSKNIKTRDDFEIEICKYLSSLNDSHTYVLRDPTLGTDSTLNRIGSFSLDVEYSIKHDDICLKPEGEDANASPKNTVISIDGVKGKKILQTIAEICPSDTPLMKKGIQNRYALDKEMLRLSGVDVEKEELEIVTEDGKITASFKDTAVAAPNETKTAEADNKKMIICKRILFSYFSAKK